MYIKPAIDNLCESDSSDSSADDATIESPDGSLQRLMKDFQQKLQVQYIGNSDTKTHITINENFVVENLLEWARNACDNDFLWCSSIGLTLEE